MAISYQMSLTDQSMLDDQSLTRWHKFFNMSDDKIPMDTKGLYAMAKLTQVALVNYMCLRKVYAEEFFIKKKYGRFKFWTLNKKTDKGAKLDEIIRQAGKFIKISSLKALRLQFFHKPGEISEELHFQFYYGKEMHIQLSFGEGVSEDLDMSTCTFDTFLNDFGKILGTIHSYCDHLNPLPNCEKRFRASFCKKIPDDFNTGEFNVVSGRTEYASNMTTLKIGTVGLPGIGSGAVLRTCYSSDDIDKLIEKAIPQMIQNEIMSIFGDGETVTESARGSQSLFEGMTYRESVDGSVLPTQYQGRDEAQVEKIVEDQPSVLRVQERATVAEIPADPMSSRVQERAVVGEVPADSPPMPSEIVTSLEISLSPKPQDWHHSTIVDITDPNKANQTAQSGQVEENLSDQDPYVVKRKAAVKRKQTNREVLEEAASKQSSKKRRRL